MRGEAASIVSTAQAVARSLTIRVAEHLAKHLSRLMRHAEDLATPHTHCLMFATYWFRPILTELLGAAKEPMDGNRRRALSGPVKVALNQHTKSTAGVNVVSRVSTLMVWFPAKWASKILPVRPCCNNACIHGSRRAGTAAVLKRQLEKPKQQKRNNRAKVSAADVQIPQPDLRIGPSAHRKKSGRPK